MSVRAVPFYCPFCGEQDSAPTTPASRLAVRVVRARFELTPIAVGGEA